MSGTYKVNGDKLTGLTVYSTLPVGTPMAWLSDNLPVGFLKFDGAEYNQSDYPDLYNIVKDIEAFQSETEGKFKIPDLSGRVLQGADSVIGALLEAGLPNIKGSIKPGQAEFVNDVDEAFEKEVLTEYIAYHPGSLTLTTQKVTFAASRSNPIYSDDCDTVQPPAFTVNWIIKAVDYVSLPQNAIDDTRTTTGNAWSAEKINNTIETLIDEKLLDKLVEKIAEYTENYNKLSDYEPITMSTSNTNPYIVPYDGFITWNDNNNASDTFYLNGIAIVVEGTGEDHNSRQGTTFPVNKGDTCYAQRTPTNCYARWYNQR